MHTDNLKHVRRLLARTLNLCMRTISITNYENLKGKLLAVLSKRERRCNVPVLSYALSVQEIATQESMAEIYLINFIFDRLGDSYVHASIFSSTIKELITNW